MSLFLCRRLQRSWFDAVPRTQSTDFWQVKVTKRVTSWNFPNSAAASQVFFIFFKRGNINITSEDYNKLQMKFMQCILMEI